MIASSLKRWILLLLMPVAGLDPAQASFESVPRVIGAARLPRDPTPHDVDGDGDTDIFYVDGSETNGVPTEVGWFENTGAGWTRRVLASGLRGPSSLDVTDLNGDGIADLVVGTRLGDGVLWFRGTGGGAFAPIATVQAPIFSMEEVNAADLNGDGRMDLIISTSSGPRWLRQTATGFAAPVVIVTVSGQFPEQHKCEAHDFDRDGDIDLVFAIGGAERLIFCRNNGNGTFAAGVNLATIRDTYALDTEDLDGDGLRDVVSGGGGFNDRRVFWFKNLGGGNFSAARQLDPELLAINLNSAVISDFDRDGDPDVVASAYQGPVIWFANQGGGVFSARKQISQGGGGMRDMVEGDLDGDGDPDLMAAQWDDDQFVWYANTTPPPVIPPPQVVSFTADDTSVAADATLRWQTSGATGIEISPLLGTVSAGGNRKLTLEETTTFTLTASNGGGTTTKTLTVVVGEAPRIFSFSAVDDTVARGQRADLRWDVAGAERVMLSTVSGVVAGGSHQPVINSSTTFTLRATNEFGESTAEVRITAGDPPTMTLLRANPSTVRLNQSVELIWSASGADTAHVSGVGEVPVGESTAVRPASTRSYTVTVSNDFGSASRTVAVAVSDPLLSRTLKTLSNSPFGIMDVHFADLTGDGLEDLVQVADSSFSDATLSWRRANAGGGYGPATTLQTSSDRISAPNAIDMDGDGDLDPLIGGDGPMRWYRNNQNGSSFGPTTSLGVSSIFRRLYIGDLNGDGLPDFAGGMGSELRFVPGTPGGGSGTPQVIDDFDGSVNPVQSDAADMDLDGDLDLIGGKDFDGEVYWYQFNGGIFTNRFLVYTGGERILGIRAVNTDADPFPEVLIRIAGGFIFCDGNGGDFTNARIQNIDTGGVTIRDFDLTDLDLDGDLDLVVVGRSVVFLENRGSNVFTAKDTFAVQAFGTDPDSMTVADVDRDGDPDIVVANDDVLVWLENLYRPAARPTAADAFPVVPLAEDFPLLSLSLAPFFADSDTPPASLAFSLRGTSGTDIFSSISLATGPARLLIRSGRDLNGSSTVRLRATDPTGLYAEIEMEIQVAAVPDAPRRAGTPPQVTADPAGAPVQMNVAGWFTDPDAGDLLRYSLTANSHPEILATAAVGDADGVLALEFAPYLSGGTLLEITATDLTGRTVTQEVSVTLPALPAPSVVATGGATLNRQTGLYELKITVTNDGARALGGFRLDVAGLPEGAVLRNPTGDGSGIDYLSPVAVGETVDLVLEYSVPNRSGAGVPVISAVPVLPEAPAAGSAGFAIDRCEVLPDRAVLIEFTSVPGSRYAIEYTTDGDAWLVSPVVITAAANRTQWIDRGPPHTISAPANAKSRLYRMRLLAGSAD